MRILNCLECGKPHECDDMARSVVCPGKSECQRIRRRRSHVKQNKKNQKRTQGNVRTYKFVDPLEKAFPKLEIQKPADYPELSRIAAQTRG